MRYVIAYDISHDARRERVARILSEWGDRVQLSVFEADVHHRDLPRLIDALAPHLNPPRDRLRVWRICGACKRAAHAIGGAPMADRDVSWTV